jgi:hypothetical protein
MILIKNDNGSKFEEVEAKIGDPVRIRMRYSDQSWYSKDIYIITGFRKVKNVDADLLILDKNLPSGNQNFPYNLINPDKVYYCISEYRDKKLDKIGI